jgi:hypothetical protein
MSNNAIANHIRELKKNIMKLLAYAAKKETNTVGTQY